MSSRFRLPEASGISSSRDLATPTHPVWSRDGKELVYNPRPTGFDAVSITTQPAFAFGNPRPVPKVLDGGPPGSRTPYDLTPDGRLVGIITAGHDEFMRPSSDQIQVVLHWFEDLKARVPGG